MTVHAFVDPAAIRRGLDLAGEEIRDRRLLGEIMVCEGTAFLMHYYWSDDGKQIHADIRIDGKDGPVRQAIERAGDRAFLPVGWADDILPRLFGNGQSTGGSFPTGMYPTWERPGLRVLAAPPRLLIPMLFLATARPMEGVNLEDMEPAMRIAAGAGIRAVEHLRDLVAPYIKPTAPNEGEWKRQFDKGFAYFQFGLDRFGLGLALEAEPKSLGEVAEIVGRDRDLYHLALSRFEEAFYAAADRDARQAMLDPVPIPTGDLKMDTWIGAIGEHIAQRWNLEIPAWTQEPAFMGGTAPQFWPTEPIARDIKIIETPPAFRRRLLFSMVEPLISSKFPNSMKIRMPFWE